MQNALKQCIFHIVYPKFTQKFNEGATGKKSETVAKFAVVNDAETNGSSIDVETNVIFGKVLLLQHMFYLVLIMDIKFNTTFKMATPHFYYIFEIYV